jgi:hypothetical protein
LEGWEEVIEAAYKIYKTFTRSLIAEDTCDFWLKVTGWHLDHGEDQKKQIPASNLQPKVVHLLPQ